jgi:hypothetical protein
MSSTYRPFMFGVGLGMGGLSYDSTEVVKHEAGISYALHLGFGITPRWMVLLGMDGSWAQFSFGDPSGPTAGSSLYGKRSVALTTYTAGAQFFMLNWLYSRLGLGLACVEWSESGRDGSDCRGQAAAGGVGAEFLQTYSTSLAVELAAMVARFPEAQTVSDRNDIWYNIGVNLVLNLY